jgi:purine-binding chemotaxis protein CheW
VSQSKSVTTFQSEMQPAASLHVLLMRVANELYALPTDEVREVMRWRQPTPVPGAPETIPGVIAQRGIVLPIIDLRRLLGVAAVAPDRSTRYIVAHHSDGEVAFIVDEVLDLVVLEQNSLEQPASAPETGHPQLVRSIIRYGEKPLALISVAGLLMIMEGGQGST